MRGAHSEDGMSSWVEPGCNTADHKTVAVFSDDRPHDALHVRDGGQLEELLNLLIDSGKMQGWDVPFEVTWSKTNSTNKETPSG